MKRILFLADSYVTIGCRYVPYLESLLAYIRATGNMLLMIRTNSYVQTAFTPECRYLDEYETMLNKIKLFNPDLVFSINRNGLTDEVLNNCLRPTVPIINWIVDAVSQIDQSVRKLSSRDLVTVFTSGVGEGVNSKGNLLAELKIPDEQLFLFPFFIDTFTFYDQSLPRDIDVSFVAAGYDQTLLASFISAYANAVYTSAREKPDEYVHKNLGILADVYKSHQQNYINNLYGEMESRGFDFSVLKRDRPDLLAAIQQHHFFQGYFDAHITSQNRVKNLAALVGLKIDLYGVPETIWSMQLCANNIDLIRSFNFRPVVHYAELASIYNKSKLSLNVQTYASCGSGFSFRVFDIIACKSLLLAEVSTSAAFEHLGFEEQVHYISFESPEDLRKKTDYYLNNESDRLKIVEAASERLETFLANYSLKAVLSKNFEDVGLADISAKIRDLTKEAYLASVNEPNSALVSALGW